MATRPIDEKIVAMKMDNSDFVRKASETTKSMGALTTFLNKIPGINFGRTTSELQNVQKSINGIETSRLSGAIDTVTSRFSNLGIVGTTALMNITNRAVDAGLAMVKNLTVAPVMDGFREYETKIGSIQTILANTSKYGTSVDDVTKSLGDLNDYADKTIYNFGQMTKNIGLFTNAGLKLDESTSMIKGFANAAAASGAGAEEMSRAAYQLSQGLASGYIMTMDWMSLTNAGMGNDNMKRDLIALGHAMGTLGTSTETTIQNWKESLSEGKWLTKEVFSKYLQAMAGDLDEAELLTLGLTKAQAALLVQNAKNGEDAATKVRTFTQMMGTLVEGVGSGWAESWEIIIGGFDNATQLWSGFAELIAEPFNSITKSRNNFLQTLKDKGVFEEIFTTLGVAIYVVGNAITAVTNGFDKAFSSDREGMVMSIVNGFKRLVTAMTPSQETLGKISTIFQAVGSVVRVVIKIISELGGLLLKLIPDNLGSNLLDLLEKFAKMVISFSDTILNGKALRIVMDNIGDGFSWLGDRLGDIVDDFSKLGAIVSEFFTVLTSGKAITDGVFSNDSKVVGWLTSINKASKSVIDDISSINLSLSPVVEGFGSFFSKIGSGFDWLKDKASGLKDRIAENMPNGTTLLAGGFVASLVAITGIVVKRVNDISKIFGGWGNTVEAFAESLDSVSGVLDSFSLNIKANALLTASLAIGALAVSILLLSRVDGAKIATSLGAIVGSLTAVIGGMAVMNKYDISGGAKTALSLIGMAIALSVMSSALKKFESLNPSELTKGILSMTAMMAGIAGSFALMGKFSGGGASASALQLVAIAGSVYILVGAIKRIAEIPTKELLVGLGTITLILGVVAGFAVLTSGKNLLNAAVGILAISLALNALIIPIFAIGNFPLDTLIIGLSGMTIALLALAGASMLMSGSAAGAVTILAMAVALNLLLVPITAFALMGWGPMLLGVAGIALSLASLAAVSLLLAPAVVPLLGFSAAIALMGVGMLAAGAGLTMFSTGLLTLAATSTVAVAAIITTLGALITGLISLIPTAVKFVINVIIQMAEAIRDNIPILLGIVGDMILKVLETIATYLPQFVLAAVKIITSFLEGIGEAAPKLIDSVVEMVISLVEGMSKTIEEKGPRFVNAFLDMFGSVIALVVQAGISVIKALLGWIPGVESAMDNVSETAVDSIREHFEAAKIAEEKGDEFADGIASKASDVEAAAATVSKSAITGLNTTSPQKSGEAFADDFSKGMLFRQKAVEASARRIASAADVATKDELGVHSPGDDGIEAGKGHGDGIVVGMDSTKGKVTNSAKKLANGLNVGMGDTYTMIKDKLFLKDTDVEDNKKKTTTVVDDYSDASKKIDTKTKKSAKSTKSTAKSVAKTQADLLAEAFKKSKDWIDDRKYYQKLSLNEELAAWQRVQKQYKVGTEQRKEADREVFRVQQELIKKKEDDQKAAFDKSKQWIEDQKTFSNISTMAELQNWERVQKKYKVGTEERKQADREVLRLKNEINQKLTSINDEYVANVKETNKQLIEEEKRLNDEYKQAFDDRVKSLKSFVGLFDKVKEQDSENPVSGTALVENLRGQVNSLATWSDDIQRLAQKGIDKGLLSELEEMGPSSALEIAALNDLTAAQLDQYVELWKKKSELATTQATVELRSLREDTNNNIAKLKTETELQLDEYKKVWVKKITEIRVGTSTGFVGLTDDMKSIGTNVIKGLMTGLSDSESPLYTKVQDIAKGIEKTIKETLKIKSPSRLMMPLGKFTGEGLAIGLTQSAGMVGSKAKDLALTARDSINKFLSTYEMPDFDNVLRFKAVLDDSDLKKGGLDLNNNIPYYLGTTNGLASSVKASFGQNGNKTSSASTSQAESVIGQSGPDSNRPIIIQSILNGRVIAEETFNDVNQLMGGRTNLAYVMKGV